MCVFIHICPLHYICLLGISDRVRVEYRAGPTIWTPVMPLCSHGHLWIHQHVHKCVCVRLVAQLCPTVCAHVDCSPPGSSVHGDSPGKNTGVGCRALLQGITNKLFKLLSLEDYILGV